MPVWAGGALDKPVGEHAARFELRLGERTKVVAADLAEKAGGQTEPRTAASEVRGPAADAEDALLREHFLAELRGSVHVGEDQIEVHVAHGGYLCCGHTVLLTRRASPAT